VVAIAYQGWQSQSLVSVACEEPAVEVEEWKRVHARLRRIAKKRAALDREELQLIRKAIALAIWRHLGMTSIREYLEHVMGYGPTVASERVRVAEALDAMPALEHALDVGELSYSAVREISRIATAKTEGAWVTACRGKNQRQIEDLLSEREPGDRPESPRKPDLRAKDKTFRALKPATLAALAVARLQLETERSERLDDDELLAALASRVNGGDAPNKRAATQVAVTFCPACQITRQTAGNQAIALRPEEVSRALCDAQWIDVTGQHRSVQDITPALRAKILARDHHRCRVPGCRATRCIEIHHIVPRELGGPHTPENLITLCDGHHAAHHRGEIRIEGPASTAVITMVAAARADELSFHVEDRSDHLEEQDGVLSAARVHAAGTDTTVVRADAVLALTTLGFRKPIATGAVDSALDELGSEATLERVIRGALRHCPKPGA
jgi:5-methylcytosine-specific restriction endonuclease McrA